MSKINVESDIDMYGVKRWYKSSTDILHREDGPAIIAPGEFEYYYLDGMQHRADGPAVIWEDGLVLWYNYGMLHRYDGPALYNPYNDNIQKEWYLYDIRIHSASEFQKRSGLTCEEMSILLLRYGDIK